MTWHYCSIYLNNIFEFFKSDSAFSVMYNRRYQDTSIGRTINLSPVVPIDVIFFVWISIASELRRARCVLGLPSISGTNPNNTFGRENI